MTKTITLNLHYKMKKNAFSLVELSIVLIIIGLLIAGVSSGSKLIEQAKINKAVADLRDYKGSYLTFILTYDATPGDMSDAVSFFGSDTANGDNDSQIETAASAASESLLAWEHMALAEVISGSYTQSSDGFHTAGTTGPRSALSATCYAPVYDSTSASNGLQIGTNAATVDCSGLTSLLALTVYKIDNKIDDGVGNTGDITATSATTNCQSSGTYDLDSTTKGCAFHYSFGDS